MKTDLKHDLVYPIAGDELKADSGPECEPNNDDGDRGGKFGGGGNIKLDRSVIPGWGTDLARNRPRNMQPEDPHPIVERETVVQQLPTVEILRSTERPELTPLFGTSVPPSGASGALRRAAYKQSENDMRRWLMLLFSDRVDAVEGVVEDLCEGRIPNIFKEMGLRAEWNYNRAGLMRKTAVTAIALSLAIYLLRRR